VTDSEQTHVIWLKSTASGSGDCVEVAYVDESVLVRHSRNQLGPVLSFSRPEWAAFLEDVQEGEVYPRPN
jgi:hypothetical protein